MAEQNNDKTLEWVERKLKYTGRVVKNSRDDWKLYTLMFDVGGQFPFKVNAWSGLGEKPTKSGNSLKVKELEEDEYYHVKIKIVKEAFEAHGKWHDDRTAYYITDCTKEDAEEFEASLKQGNAQEANAQKAASVAKELPASPSPSELQDFLKQFKTVAGRDVSEQDAGNAIILYYANKHAQEEFSTKLVKDYNDFKSGIKTFLDVSKVSSSVANEEQV